MGLFSNDITGIDIGAGSIKVVRIARGGNRPKLLSAALVELSPDPAVGGEHRQPTSTISRPARRSAAPMSSP